MSTYNFNGDRLSCVFVSTGVYPAVSALAEFLFELEAAVEQARNLPLDVHKVLVVGGATSDTRASRALLIHAHGHDCGSI